jgi:23S rRNA (uridine2552-2'-O)-methyltransferase
MPARSVYKLEELDRRWQLLHRGASVLDLGCAPGSWLVYAAKRVGPQGRVLGVDLKAIEVSLPPNATAHVADAFDFDPGQERFDVVLSDMAPSTTGDHGTDALRSAALAERAIDVADKRLLGGGALVVKLLEGKGIDDVVTRMRGLFGRVQRLRPKATRKSSTEIFLVGLCRTATETQGEQGSAHPTGGQ